MDVTKTSYTSSLYYPEIIYNQVHTINNGQTIYIPFNTTYTPYIRIWGELYPGEFSQVFISTAEYGFMTAYSVAGIYGYQIEIESNRLSIYSGNPSGRRVYVRMYVRE